MYKGHNVLYMKHIKYDRGHSHRTSFVLKGPLPICNNHDNYKCKLKVVTRSISEMSEVMKEPLSHEKRQVG